MYNTGIGIQLPFILDFKGPLDARSIVADMTELAAIPATQLYNGMSVYVEALDKDYRWISAESQWVEVGHATSEEPTGATVAIGTVTTGEPGTEASITNVGTATDAIFNFTIPRGADGAAGEKGDKGDQGLQGEAGADGVDGKSAKVVVGDVTTGAAGSEVVVNATTEEVDGENVTTLTFQIPQGATGADGKAFAVSKVYASVEAMNADFAGTDVAEGEFVIISCDVNDEDNAKLYCKGAAAYEFICDMSGVIGADGVSAKVVLGSVTTGDAGTEASATSSTEVVDGVNVTTINFTIPRGADGAAGEKGDKGDQGDAATVAVGTVTTGDAGTEATVTNSGTANAAVFDFVIPKGDKGDKGDQGEQGIQGEAGTAATVAIGTVTTGASTAAASVENVGTESAAVFNFVIPKGDKGDSGDIIRVGEEYATAPESKIFFRVLSSTTE